MSRSDPERLRRVRLGNLRTLLRDRCGYDLPNDDAGREYLWELLLQVSLGSEPKRKMHNIIEVWAPWMNVDERFHLMAQIERTPVSVRKVDAKTLGKRLRVTNAEREHLKVWTIAPVDLTDKQLAEQRKAKDRDRKKRRRRDAGSKPRTEYEAASVNSAEPWLALGISRATWFRRRETSPSAVKLSYYRGQTCLTEQAARPPWVAEQHRGGKAEVTSKAQNKPESTERQHGHEPLAHPHALRTDLSQSAPRTDLCHPTIGARSDFRQAIYDGLWLRGESPPRGNGASVTSESSHG